MPGESARINGRKGGRPKGVRSPWKKTLAKRRGAARALKLAEVTAERTMLEIARVAFAHRSDIWQGDRLLPLEQWPEDAKALLEGFEIIKKNAAGGDGHTDTVHKVQLARKTPALELLAKHFGLVSDKVQLEGKITLEHLIALSREADDHDDPDRDS